MVNIKDIEASYFGMYTKEAMRLNKAVRNIALFVSDIIYIREMIK